MPGYRVKLNSELAHSKGDWKDHLYVSKKDGNYKYSPEYRKQHSGRKRTGEVTSGGVEKREEAFDDGPVGTADYEERIDQAYAREQAYWAKEADETLNTAYNYYVTQTTDINVSNAEDVINAAAKVAFVKEFVNRTVNLAKVTYARYARKAKKKLQNLAKKVSIKKK